ncbi:hypothetical protein BVER_04391 [Candidatus Burkholderia verschuerenii]|uniref:Uncharacterized protein n=1 Tax=Candidatus Burkholderia verschuerenii TaxID=242163 RepID=A0A0L0MHM0_9BURK|nr:hypothetical protein [Candidatus Burkholderia verschuerenii]KND61464.1 hypothetical protein BVER_04391 [Candidatus Burkholderia verschuerenii]
MTRIARTARRRVGQVSSTIANASRHFVPQKLSAWKLALYVIVFLLPGRSFVVLAMSWSENRHRRRASDVAKSAQPSSHPLLPTPCSCPGGGASGA